MLTSIDISSGGCSGRCVCMKLPRLGRRLERLPLSAHTRPSKAQVDVPERSNRVVNSRVLPSGVGGLSVGLVNQSGVKRHTFTQHIKYPEQKQMTTRLLVAAADTSRASVPSSHAKAGGGC